MTADERRRVKVAVDVAKRARLERASAGKRGRGADLSHGTYSSYYFEVCRCALCVEAAALKRRAYYANRRKVLAALTVGALLPAPQASAEALTEGHRLIVPDGSCQPARAAPAGGRAEARQSSDEGSVAA